MNTFTNNFEERGQNIQSFFTLLTEIDENTEFKSVRSDTINIYSPVIEGKKAVRFMSKDDGYDLITEDSEISRERELSCACEYEINSEFYYSIPRTQFELGKLFKLTGSALAKPSFERDRYIQYLMTKTPTPITLIIRKDNLGHKKIISCRSKRYENIPQKTLKDLILTFIKAGDYGLLECSNYKVNYDISEIDFELPEIWEFVTPELYDDYKDLVLGIRFSTGSTGYSLLRVDMTVRSKTGKAVVILDSCSAKHTKGFNLNEYKDEVFKHIWCQFYAIPNSLKERKKEIVINGTETDGKDKLEFVIAKALKKLQINKIFSANEEITEKRKTNWNKQIVDFIVNSLYADGKTVTGYDIAKAIMFLSDSLTSLPESYKIKLNECLGQAPFMSYLYDSDYVALKKMLEI